MLFHTERSQLRWFRHLISKPSRKLEDVARENGIWAIISSYHCDSDKDKHKEMIWNSVPFVWYIIEHELSHFFFFFSVRGTQAYNIFTIKCFTQVGLIYGSYSWSSLPSLRRLVWVCVTSYWWQGELVKWRVNVACSFQHALSRGLKDCKNRKGSRIWKIYLKIN